MTGFSFPRKSEISIMYPSIYWVFISKHIGRSTASFSSRAHLIGRFFQFLLFFTIFNRIFRDRVLTSWKKWDSHLLSLDLLRFYIKKYWKSYGSSLFRGSSCRWLYPVFGTGLELHDFKSYFSGFKLLRKSL